MWSAEEWAREHEDAIALFGAANISIESVYYDVMHSKYLGMDSYLLGGVLHYLVDIKLGVAGTSQDRLDALWERISDEYRHQKTSTRYNSMSLTMFRPGKAAFAHLKGKAAELKGLISVLLGVCRQGFLDATNREENLMLRALEQSLLIDSILNHNVAKVVLPHDQKMMLTNAVRSCNQLIGALGAHFHNLGHPIFNYTVKNHVLEHVALDSDRLNPVLTWTFSAEDFMLRIRHLVAASAHGSSPIHVQNVVLQKWLRGFELGLWPSMANLR